MCNLMCVSLSSESRKYGFKNAPQPYYTVGNEGKMFIWTF